jgi:hypothetical protein
VDNFCVPTPFATKSDLSHRRRPMRSLSAFAILYQYRVIPDEMSVPHSDPAIISGLQRKGVPVQFAIAAQPAIEVLRNGEEGIREGRESN